jgi:hypothetical protein
MRLFILVAALAMAAPAALAQGRLQAQAQTADQAALPAYMVVEGQYPTEAIGQQALTVVCPGQHVVLGAGYTALVREPARSGQRPGRLREGGLERVRSMPDTNGRAWRVEAVSPDAQSMKTKWRLVVRVVCMAPIR